MKLANKALVIGINHYAGRPLRYGVKNAMKIARVLDTSRNSLVFSTDILTDEHTALETPQIKTAIRELFSGASEVVLLYFSGYGYLQQRDHQVLLPTAASATEEDALLLQDILQWASASTAKHKIIVLDCYHPEHRPLPQRNALDIRNFPQGVMVLSACREEDSAMEWDEENLFASLLMNSFSDVPMGTLPQQTIQDYDRYISEQFQNSHNGTTSSR